MALLADPPFAQRIDSSMAAILYAIDQSDDPLKAWQDSNNRLAEIRKDVARSIGDSTVNKAAAIYRWIHAEFGLIKAVLAKLDTPARASVVAEINSDAHTALRQAYVNTGGDLEHNYGMENLGIVLPNPLPSNPGVKTESDSTQGGSGGGRAKRRQVDRGNNTTATLRPPASTSPLSSTTGTATPPPPSAAAAPPFAAGTSTPPPPTAAESLTTNDGSMRVDTAAQITVDFSTQPVAATLDQGVICFDDDDDDDGSDDN